MKVNPIQLIMQIYLELTKDRRKAILKDFFKFALPKVQASKYFIAKKLINEYLNIKGKKTNEVQELWDLINQRMRVVLRKWNSVQCIKNFTKKTYIVTNPKLIKWKE
jgi:gas vesicle protein